MKTRKKTAAKSKLMYVGAVDLGGSTVKAGILRYNRATGEQAFEPAATQVPSKAQDRDPMLTLEQMKLALELVCRQVHVKVSELACVGLDTPGPASVGGVLEKSGNFPGEKWDKFASRDEFNRLLGLPVYYLNDGDAAAFGEYLQETSIDPSFSDKTLVGLFPGTGLGGGVVLRGNLVTSSYGPASELGHIKLPGHLVDETELVSCTCGGKYCAEAFISIMAIKQQLERALKEPKWAAHSMNQPGESILDKARRLLKLTNETGDALGMEIFMKQAQALGVLCAQLSVTYGNDLFVIGGGIAEFAGKEFRKAYMDRVKAGFYANTMVAYQRAYDAGDIKFQWAVLGDNAASAGAALYALREHNKR